MTKMRVHELAKELGIENKELIELLQKKNIDVKNHMSSLEDSVAEEICGENRVESLKLSNVKTGEKREISLQGVFIAVGITPESQAFEGLVDMEGGYIKAGEDCLSSAPGIFAAGDVRQKQLRQIITAAADGANAVTSAERYLMKH